MVAKYEADQLLSLEQENLIKEQPHIKEVFEHMIGWSSKKQDEHKRQLNEWENHKCYKH